MGHSDGSHDADLQREKDEKEMNMKWCSRYNLCVSLQYVCLCIFQLSYIWYLFGFSEGAQSWICQ